MSLFLGVMKKLFEYYSAFLPKQNIYSEFSIPAEHSMVGSSVLASCFICISMQVTDDTGNSCSTLGTPFINNCNYSTVYYLLQHIYGDIRYANSSAAIPSNVSLS